MSRRSGRETRGETGWCASPFREEPLNRGSSVAEDSIFVLKGRTSRFCAGIVLAAMIGAAAFGQAPVLREADAEERAAIRARVDQFLRAEFENYQEQGVAREMFVVRDLGETYRHDPVFKDDPTGGWPAFPLADPIVVVSSYGVNAISISPDGAHATAEITYQCLIASEGYGVSGGRRLRREGRGENLTLKLTKNVSATHDGGAAPQWWIVNPPIQHISLAALKQAFRAEIALMEVIKEPSRAQRAYRDWLAQELAFLEAPSKGF